MISAGKEKTSPQGRVNKTARLVWSCSALLLSKRSCLDRSMAGVLLGCHSQQRRLLLPTWLSEVHPIRKHLHSPCICVSLLGSGAGGEARQWAMQRPSEVNSIYFHLLHHCTENGA